MALKFHLITVPHSGTRFLNQMFFRIGFGNIQESTPRIVRRPENVQPEHTRLVEYRMNHWEISNKDIPTFVKEHNLPAVTTLQHPHKVALSWMRRTEQKGFSNLTMDNLLGIYDTMIYCCTKLRMVYFDINCPIEKREPHMVSMLQQLGVYEHADKEVLTQHIHNWRPVGQTYSETKDYFEKHGEPPPELYNWSRFDRAVNWYNKKLKECRYDYITS